jgi:hypothetical protein
VLTCAIWAGQVADFHDPPNPYGAGPTIRNHGGNNSHLALHGGFVQHREALLLTSALDADDALQFKPTGNFAFSALSTNLILPADADEWQFLLPDGAKHIPAMDPSTGQLALGVTTLPLNATVCLRVGGAALGVKIFELDGIGGQPPQLQLVADSQGRLLNAARLSAIHYTSADGKPQWLNGTTSSSHARFAALAVAAAARTSTELSRICAAVHDAPTTSTIVGGPAGVWTAAATANTAGDASAPKLVPVELAVGRDLDCSMASGVRRNQSTHTSWNCLTYRKVNGVDLVAGPWRVNGKSMAEVLAPA